MKCHFCGYINPEGKDKCERCGKTLVSDKSIDEKTKMNAGNHEKATELHASNAAYNPKGPLGDKTFNPKATMREQSSASDTKGVCSKCGYELDSDGNCPMCGGADASLEPQKPVERKPFNPSATLRPQRKGPKEGSFVLVPISEENGLPEGLPLHYEGNDVCLNRSNTDPKNKTITSQAQAVICCEDGHWTIKDQSDMLTTFVQASDAIELKSGSLILLGNQLYRFDAN